MSRDLPPIHTDEDTAKAMDRLADAMLAVPSARDLLAATAPPLDPRAIPAWYKPSVPVPSRDKQDEERYSPAERQAEYEAWTKALLCEWPYAFADAVLEARDRLDALPKDEPRSTLLHLPGASS